MRLAIDIEGDTPAAVAGLVAALFGRLPADTFALAALARRLDAPTATLRGALSAAGGPVGELRGAELLGRRVPRRAGAVIDWQATTDPAGVETSSRGSYEPPTLRPP
ncbi:MAG TPA: hypothetical protein VD866_32160 [Urbifossiella sp.]|nr:hypothetical protein [Urbifossiella sp.]